MAPTPTGSVAAGTPLRGVEASADRPGAGRERTSATGATRVAGLDGLRALAVLLVLGFHFGAGGLVGGYFGVDVFYVLSGFLITGLLVGEYERRGRIGLGAFWLRRARRLLPALLVMVAVVTLLVRFAEPAGHFHDFRMSALSALFYFSNWWQIAASGNYFASAAPLSPLTHTWSLAVEEQFYLVWPFVVLAVFRLARTPARGVRVLLGVSVAGALASAVEMAVRYRPTGSVTRLYFGTDTHAQSVLVGAALACVLTLVQRRRARPGMDPAARTRVGRVAVVAVGLAGLAGVLALSWRVGGTSAVAYRGGFLLAGLCSAAVIAAVVAAPGGPLARLFALRPAVALGTVSYGVYLWHFPVAVFLDASRTGLTGGTLLAARTAVTLALAAASWLLLERPVLEGSFWRTVRAAGPTAAAVAATAGLVVAGTAAPGAAAGTTGAPGAAAGTTGAPGAAAGPTGAPGAAAGTTGAPGAAAGTTGAPGAAAGTTGAPGAAAGPTGAPGAAAGPRGLTGARASAAQWEAVHVTSFAGAGSRLRVLIVGDSLALTVAVGMAPYAAAYGIDLGGRSHTGCGVALALPLDDHGVVGDPFPNCPTWPTWWADDVRQLHPQVVGLVIGFWEVVDRWYQGRWQHLGDPAFDAYETAQLERAVAILGSGGAKVALFTAPYFHTGEQPDGAPWPQDAPARVDRLNRIIEAVAARHPATVSVVPLHRVLDPAGHFTWTIDGQVVRQGDGVHTTVAAGPILARGILPELAALGRSS